MSDAFPEIPETLYGLNKRLLFVTEALRSLGNDPSILDIGCGTGEFLTLPLAHRGWRITGLDVHAASVERANTLALGLPHARFVCGSLNDVADKVDAIILSEVIEHVSDARMLLQAIRLKLKADGLLILTLPNGYGPFELDQYFSKRNFLWIRSLHSWYVRTMRKKDRPIATYNEESPHINFFSWSAIRELIHLSGFRVVQYRARTFIAGDYASVLVSACGFARVPTGWLIRCNATIADRLPSQLVSGWMFVCKAR